MTKQYPRPTQRMGDELRAAREQLNLSTQAAAAAAEISPGYLFKLENGYVGTPSPRVLHRLSAVLDIGYWDLMGLADYVVPAGPGTPATTEVAPAVSDPLERIARAMEEIVGELREIRQVLEPDRNTS
jgi:transcriptional regulator with XRE-family HTH domain